jgi:hypothetical protein
MHYRKKDIYELLTETRYEECNVGAAKHRRRGGFVYWRDFAI